MPNPNDAVVVLENAGLRRSGRWLVRGVSFGLHRGEIVTLIGPNGSGKSTTAKMALRIIPPDEGAVIRQPGLQVSYVPQSIAIDWTLPLTVGRFMNLTAPVSVDAARSALESTGVNHLAGAELRNLSGGEFQRVLLARAIARNPQLLVLDEPVQGVDFAGEASLYKLIAEIRDRLGCAILLISHDLHVVMAATDRVICLNGHVCCQGTPVAVAQSPQYRQLFGDRANAALAFYEHNHDHRHLPDGRVMHGDGSITDHCHPDDGHHHDGDDHDHGHEKAHRHAG